MSVACVLLSCFKKKYARSEGDLAQNVHRDGLLAKVVGSLCIVLMPEITPIAQKVASLCLWIVLACLRNVSVACASRHSERSEQGNLLSKGSIQALEQHTSYRHIPQTSRRSEQSKRGHLLSERIFFTSMRTAHKLPTHFTSKQTQRTV